MAPVFLCSAAPTKIAGSEQATIPATSEAQQNDRSDPRALSSGLSLALLMIDSLYIPRPGPGLSWKEHDGDPDQFSQFVLKFLDQRAHAIE
jgi:hypothetical protein